MYRILHTQGRVGLFILWVGLFSGCHGSEIERTEKDKELVSLIMDMHVAEAAMGKVPDKFKDSLRLVYREEVARLHDLTPDKLDDILVSLQEDPERFKELTKLAMVKLDSLERSLH